MSLLRVIARPLLASIFVVQGAKALRDPDALAERAAPVTDRIAPMLRRVAPESVAEYVPDDARSMVRVNGIVHILGGLALVTGKGRRLGAAMLAGSMVPTTLAGHAFWQVKDDPDARAQQTVHFLKNLSILGGLLIAAGDTEGKPGVAWRARRGVQSARKSSSRALHTARREAKLASKSARAELPF